MRSLHRLLTKHVDVILCLGLLSIVVYMADPGFMSPDSVDQLRVAVSGQYNDHHPAIMSFVWHMINEIHFGPLGMLIVQNILFFSGLLLLMRCAFQNPIARLCAIAAFTVFPPVFTELGVIWKDVVLMCSYFLACGILLHATERPNRAYWSLIPLFYGTSVRFNSIAALFPIAIWFGLIVCRKNVIRAGIVSGLVTFGIFGSSMLINARLAEGRNTYLFQTIQFHDLAGISVRKRKLVTDYFQMPIAELSTLYSPNTDRPTWKMTSRDTYNPADQARITKQWLTQIFENPREYLSHRAAVFRILLGYRTKEVMLPFFATFTQNPWRFDFKHAWAVRLFYRIPFRYCNSVLFRGYAYVVLCIGLLIVALLEMKKPQSMAIIYISASGICYALCYFFVAPAGDFRYLYWTVIASLIGLTLWASSLINSLLI